MGRNKLFETDFFGRFLYCDLTTANIEFGGSVFELLFFPMLYYCLRFEFGSRMLTNRFMSEVKKEKAKLKLPVIFVKEYKVGSSAPFLQIRFCFIL